MPRRKVSGARASNIAAQISGTSNITSTGTSSRSSRYGAAESSITPVSGTTPSQSVLSPPAEPSSPTSPTRRSRTAASASLAMTPRTPPSASGSSTKRRRTSAASSGNPAQTPESSLRRSARTAAHREAQQDDPFKGSELRRRLSSAELAGRKHILRIIQQPTIGCGFGTNVLSRLPLAPPLIVQLIVTNMSGEILSADSEMPYLVCHVSLITDTGQNADLLAPVAGSGLTSASVSPSTPSPIAARGTRPRRGRRSRGSGSSTQSRTSTSTSSQSSPPSPVRMLYGTLVASPQQFLVPDVDDTSEGTYFVFPEISVRTRGRYRLRVSLLRLPSTDSPQSSPGTSTTTTSVVLTDPFNIVLSSHYVAPPISDITLHFARQGAGLLLPSGIRSG